MTCCGAQDRFRQNALPINGLHTIRGGSWLAAAYRGPARVRCSAASKNMTNVESADLRCGATRREACRSGARNGQNAARRRNENERRPRMGSGERGPKKRKGRS
ncbi:hypothetical protein WJ28_05505 [Burkholderia thailandensis]|nr:hypothetical protein WJ27_20325 [Burkholderia thailandensis]KVG07702.1 hypothetical protein WJ25_15815 [Burkholderia thailandensis]KVG19616.1 hypothetical protein WJ28_05505 [Burkholderia thailandensis]